MGIIGKDANQSVSDGSFALQAGGSIKITTGLSAADVIQLFDVLFQNQFPKIQEVAREQAISNRRELETLVISELQKNSEKIIIDKFKDPDIQALLNDALTFAARKGKKSHPDLLSKLIVEKVSGGNSDLMEIILTEAVSVVPKLTKSQISLICVIFVLNDVQMTAIPAKNILHMLDSFHQKFEQYLGSKFDLSPTSLKHLSYTGACNYNDFMVRDTVDSYLHKYAYFGASNAEEAKKKLGFIAPAIFRFINKINAPQIGGVNLTGVGQAIAITTLKEIAPFDYAQWLK
ncbi:LPO_1073/Vpar_1526 family protein [Cronobacter muytjensii]|uniref:LPO_1073/Vpar_1526 family protein n=1 Tax=Cronobacter muytjensii TaxID=413501 RepID=UPI0034D60617